ncbi:UDP-3-O-acylglucosamine N-acyltransferase [Steroidobacter agaridevorans]|uniref:UDP-3-O-acylglucosamine N-acyltransferase n=1 Tax=Steroidobacter agaridevorans TaxID=2695856 RepID=A0A829YBU5_9GAMM|nr:UDP-3-O-(3-hydroxymyristoyl)glucosamine N-acyltransferase [Steroidobacter agaridevorans]GFE80749.1 UDP-3-O-acylglucosamine N-acyltransferase [Steroidobacter agaridevorans]GFE87850.1 UDP-3-O-acylglucosamine N-acyltransferase [Steroidobacter agaridevorans]
MSAQPGLSLGEIAVRFGCILKGDPDLRVSRVAALESADAASVTFLANPRYRRYLQQTKAGVVVLDPKLADACPVSALLAKNPYATYARIAALLYPPPAAPPGRHATSVVDASAQIDASASIGPHAVIGANVKIGARTAIGPGCVVMDDVTIGDDTRLTANVTLCRGVIVGDRCLFHPSVVIGADGFGLAPDQGEWLKVPQVGTVRIGSDVEIGASTTIDRGAIDDTVIGDGVKMDNQIQIGHNVRIGDHTAIAGCAGISGSATIGKRCMIGGMAGVAGHLSICDDVVITGKSFVSGSIRKPGYYSSGIPVDETSRFRKNAARFQHLDEFVREVRRERGAASDGEETDSREE